MALIPLPRTEPTVIVVQSDDRLTGKIRNTLESLRCKMAHYRDASALLDSIDRRQLRGLSGALLITDLRLPTISGIRLLQELETRRLVLPSIVTTAWVDEGIRGLLRSLGARHVLIKPISEERLLESITETEQLFWSGFSFASSAPPASPRRHTT